MKIRNLKYVLVTALILVAFQLKAQVNTEQIVVPLSKPGLKGSIKVNLISGSIIVNGYSGKEVVINAKAMQERGHDDDNDKNKEGLKKLNSNAFSLKVEEKDNEIKVSSHYSSRMVSIEIKVPKNFSVDVLKARRREIQPLRSRGRG